MGTEETHDDHGHHLPAVEDWPRGFGEASWWPFVTAVGGAGVYVAAALYILGRGEDAIVGPVVGPAAFVGSIALFLVGIYGWLYHAFVSHFWSRSASEKGESKLRWGMIAFLGSELGTFGALFGYYFYIRAGTWPPQELPHLLGSLVLVNTAILVLSSFTLHWAHVGIRQDDRKKFVGGLAVTLLLGLIFIGGQVYEYYEFIVHSNFSLTDGIFGTAFYGLTGLHGLHVSLGAVILGIVFVRALMGQYSAERHVSVSTASMYWHFVDVVWIFLVVVLYAGAEIGA
ncbi:cytochrome c oxidase subunit 3 [Halopelagius inordinatus]|uniref:Cytochrome c oxidase subunit 3 n=1 Tax=Halopelagius inordinatus TaxID=553467 RepID=A0A1I2NT49_9EURY|nr:heme-copper oxidase subunit III [Halopelagius inordinatus]SFG04441.1 cytochrome c oxidase subunit 3 [Halopelagius inordinatus]